MLARMRSSTLRGIEATPIDVEVDVVGGLPSYHVVGLPAPSVREGAVRIRAALEAVGQALPQKKITINLAPADLPKPGTAFDLPIAIGVLLAECELDPAPVDRLMLLGELGLDGTLRPVRGALAAAILARELGLRGVVVPAASAAEAAVVEGIEVLAADHLQEVVAMVTGGAPLRRARPRAATARAPGFDLADVRGQLEARSALEVAVAGGHNLLLVGPPGIGNPEDTGFTRPRGVPRPAGAGPTIITREPTRCAPVSGTGSSRIDRATRCASTTVSRRSWRWRSRSTSARRRCGAVDSKVGRAASAAATCSWVTWGR